MDILFNLLADQPDQTFLWVALAVIVVLFVGYTFYSNKKRNKQIAEEKAKRDSIQPGYRITTIGGIIGTVVEIDHEANTFVIETGIGENKSTLKFDKQAIYTFEAPVTEETEVKDDVFTGEDGENAEENSAGEEKPGQNAESAEENTEKTDAAEEIGADKE